MNPSSTTYTNNLTRSDTAGRISQLRVIGMDGPSTRAKIDFTYDAQSRVTAIKQGSVGVSTYLTTKTYAYSSGVTEVTDGRGKTATYSIDSLGRVASTEDALGNTRSQTWTANSDIATTTDALGGTPGNTTTYSYDSLNNATSVALPTGAAASAVYATGVGCTGSGGSAYQPKCSTDAAGNGKAFKYDSNGNVTGIEDTTSGGTGAVTQQYTYVDNGYGCGSAGGFDGQVCTATDGEGNITAYQYDVDGNLIKVIPPAPMGETSYTHDSLGRVTSVTDGNGDTTSYTYNERDDILVTTFDNSGSLTTEYYPNGLRFSEAQSDGVIRYFNYDTTYKIVKEVFDPGTTVVIDYSYDAAGNLIEHKDNNYGAVGYVYDDANRLIQLIEPGGSCPTGTGSPANSGCVKFEYDANGAETKRTYPGNATVTTINDGAGRPTRMTAKDAGGVVKVDVGYSFAAAGQSGPSADRTAVQTRTSHAEQGIPAGAVTSYGYDSLNRLTSAIEKNGATTTASWAYSYDDAGNRTQQIRSGATGATAGTITYGYNAANQLTTSSAGTTTWTYDAAGNQTRNGITGQITAVNDRGAVTAIGATTYTAFGQGNTDQFARSASSTQYINSRLGLMSENLGGPSRAFARTPEGNPVGARLGGGSRYYYVSDDLGSVIGLFDRTGAYLGGYSYSPYGEARSTGTNSAVSTNNNLRYIAGYYDSPSGLYKLGARYYDPSLGRFTQMDPSGQEANPYTYGTCNPVNSKDPTGLASWTTASRVLAGLFATGSAYDVLSGQGTGAGFLAGAAAEIACGAFAAALGVTTGGAGFAAVLVCGVVGAAVTAEVDRAVG